MLLVCFIAKINLTVILNFNLECFSCFPDVLGVKGSYSPPERIPWCIGFKSTRASESESEVSESSSTVYFVKGYESAVTAIVTDSEDDLFFLNGMQVSIFLKPATFNPFSPMIILVILYAVCLHILTMLVRGFGIKSTNKPLIHIFIYSHQ